MPNSNIDYYSKYIKYKTKYIDLLKINNDRQNVTHKTIENLRSKL